MAFDFELSTIQPKGRAPKEIMAVMRKLINAKHSIDVIHVTPQQHEMLSQVALSTLKKQVDIKVGRLSFMGSPLQVHRD